MLDAAPDPITAAAPITITAAAPTHTLSPVPPDLAAKLNQLHTLYGRDQPLADILDGLNTRLALARQLYGPNRSIAAIVSGIYAKLYRLLKLYGSNDIECVLDGIIERKERLNRLVELQGKTKVAIAEQEEMLILRQFTVGNTSAT